VSDLGDLLELMHTAHQRPTSLRAVVHHWADNELSREAMEHLQKQQTRGSVEMFVIGAGAGQPPPYIDETYDWAQEPGRRWRVEWTRQGKAHMTILNGRRWWSSGSLDGFTTNVRPDGTIAENVGGGLPSPALATVFDPASMAAAVAIFRVVRLSQKGRDVISAAARPRLDRERGVHLFALGSPYADEVQFSIDVATGFALRCEMLLDGRVFMLWEIEEMDLEHDPPPSLFEGPADARLPPVPPMPDDAAVRRMFEEHRRLRPPSE
jgi:hypothetical protein